MTCESCGEKPKHPAKDFTKAVVEIDNPGSIVLLRKVVIPASLGDEESVPPAIGKYRNVILTYEINKHTYIYSSDGIPTYLQTDISQDVLTKINNLELGLQGESKQRKDADTAIDGRLTVVEGEAATALQPSAIDKVVMTDIALDANASTTTVQINGAKENLLTGAQTTKNLPLPVASHDEAGVMNSATFDAVTSNTSTVNSLLNGSVAITGLGASPTQAELTTAWQSETGLTTLINRAGIFDVTNDRVWTYYTNTTTWYPAANSTQVTVSTFTNLSEGTIKGSAVTGQIFAENDGTGSVNGWDSLVGRVSTLESNTSNLPTVFTTNEWNALWA
jgi:hypothetical protein